MLREEISVTLKAVLLAERNVELYQQAIEAEQVAQEGRWLAEEADRLKSRFLSMVSHELRTPLVLLVGLSEMMLRERTSDHRPPLPEPYRQDLARIHVSAQQLDTWCATCWTSPAARWGQLRLVKGPLDLGQVLKAVALVGEQMARVQGLSWQITLPENLPRCMGMRHACSRWRLTWWQTPSSLQHAARSRSARGGRGDGHGLRERYRAGRAGRRARGDL